MTDERVDPTRYSWYRPADPSWADRETIGKVRSRIKKIDQRLDVWWVPAWKPDDAERPGRWGIVYWMQRASRWSPVFYWEDAAGGFREMSTDCVEELLRRLAECDTSHDGKDVYSIEKAKQLLTNRRAEERSEELRDVLRQHYRDYGMRLNGKLLTVGPGGPRSRRGVNGDLGVDEDFEREMRDRGIR